MFTKFRTDFFSKNLFVTLIAASLAIHGIIIFLSPQTSQILSLRSLRDSFVREPSDYTVTLDLEDSAASKETREKDVKQNKNETPEGKKEKEPEKKQHKIFTDTSDNKEDEESTIESDKIGEKGSLAKDYFPNDKRPINNEPHAEGHSTAPLLGKGGSNLPGGGKSQPQEQVVARQPVAPVDSHQDKNMPPRYANLPKGIEKQGEPVTSAQLPQKQMLSQESKGETTEAEEPAKTDKEVKTKNAGEIPRKEQQASERSVPQNEEEGEPISSREGVLFTEKKDDGTNTSKTDEKELSEKEPLEKKEEDKTAKEEIETHEEKKTRELKETKEREEAKEAKSIVAHKQEMVVPPSESPGAEPQRMFERGLDEQENPGEIPRPKVSINVNAKKEGSGNDPVLFEDTLSNAEIAGAPSFNVKKHEYADYFKHIRDRISLYWFLGYGTRAEIKLETRDDKPIIVEFKVLPDGSIDDAKIVDDAGNFPLASRLISSIKNAAPLNPFPAKIKEPSIEVRFNFYFF
ncbi:MAG TPA: hypothetical protein ACFYDZ_02095 [Candidatus Brocadiaceae bacterium]